MYFKPSRNSHTHCKAFLSPNCSLWLAPARPNKNRLLGLPIKLQRIWTALAPLVEYYRLLSPLLGGVNISRFNIMLYLSQWCSVSPFPQKHWWYFIVGERQALHEPELLQELAEPWRVTPETEHRPQFGCYFIIFYALGTESKVCPEMSMKIRQLHKGQWPSPLTVESFAPSPLPLRVRGTGIGMSEMTYFPHDSLKVNPDSFITRSM